MELWLVSEKPENKGALVPANVFDKVTFNLHPSFGARATQGMYWSLSLFFVFCFPSSWLLRLQPAALFVKQTDRLTRIIAWNSLQAAAVPDSGGRMG